MKTEEKIKDKMMANNRIILDACCGSRMFYTNKHNPNVIYMDNREFEGTLCDGRKLEVKPDVVADFRNIPYENNSFNLVIFDPPHLLKIGENSWMYKKYGRLNKDTWQTDIKQGFIECMRVLKPYGTLIFKWSTRDITYKELISAIDAAPLIFHKNNRTYFLVFIKEQQ